MNIAIVTPTQKSEISYSEHKRLKVSLKANSSLDHFFVIPESLDTRQLRKAFPKSKFKRFDDKFFISRDSYSSLMLDPKFYESFSDYVYILICQLDAILLKGVDPILHKNFTYLGAAWNPSIYVTKFFNQLYFNKIKFSSPISYELESGNGGLSLRKTQDIFEALISAQKSRFLSSVVWENRKANEDILIVYILGQLGYPLISKVFANKFFIESTPINEYNFDNIYGFHKLSKFDLSLENRILAKLYSD